MENKKKLFLHMLKQSLISSRFFSLVFWKYKVMSFLLSIHSEWKKKEFRELWVGRKYKVWNDLHDMFFAKFVIWNFWV